MFYVLSKKRKWGERERERDIFVLVDKKRNARDA